MGAAPYCVCGSEAMLGFLECEEGSFVESLLTRGMSSSGLEVCLFLLDSKASTLITWSNDERNIVRWEGGNRRKLVLPEGLEEGLSVELRDLCRLVLDVLFTYKYCKYDKSGGCSSEYGGNRELTIDFKTSQPKYLVLSDGMMRESPWRGAGVAIPMFSVRSEADLGVGEFLDLKLLVDWAVESGFHLVQLLPINDTSVNGMWWDSYPYSSLSVFALHPLYLRVEALSANIPEDIKQEIKQARLQLDKKAVDYDATMATKLSIAKKIFIQEKDKILNSSSFQQYFSENQNWLKPYAAFCFLRDFFETSDHSQWGRFFLNFQEEKLSEAAEYARKKGVVLKGDIPIGVDRNSVDTWVYPNLFRMNTSPGHHLTILIKTGRIGDFQLTTGKRCPRTTMDGRARFTQNLELPDHAMTGLCGKFRPSIPISQEELESEGVWDFNRLTRPYIRSEFLQFKEDCNTEKKVASKLKLFLEKSVLERVKRNSTKTFDLLSIRVPIDVVNLSSPGFASTQRRLYNRPAMEETINDPTNPKHYWQYQDGAASHLLETPFLRQNSVVKIAGTKLMHQSTECPINYWEEDSKGFRT
nr:4-alpha-glucanotransferase DPE2 [Ipomoea batatas]